MANEKLMSAKLALTDKRRLTVQKRDIVHAVNQWVDESAREESGCILWYNSKSAEQAFVVDGGKMPDFSPEIYMSSQSRAVDRAMLDMPSEFLGAIFAVHVLPGGVEAHRKTFMRYYKCSQAKFYSYLDNAYWFIAPYLRKKV